MNVHFTILVGLFELTVGQKGHKKQRTAHQNKQKTNEYLFSSNTEMKGYSSADNEDGSKYCHEKWNIDSSSISAWW